MSLSPSPPTATTRDCRTSSVVAYAWVTDIIVAVRGGPILREVDHWCGGFSALEGRTEPHVLLPPRARPTQVAVSWDIDKVQVVPGQPATRTQYFLWYFIMRSCIADYSGMEGNIGFELASRVGTGHSQYSTRLYNAPVSPFMQEKSFEGCTDGALSIRLLEVPDESRAT